MNIIFNNDFVSNIYIGSDGKIHRVKGGADTALNFSSYKNAVGGDIIIYDLVSGAASTNTRDATATISGLGIVTYCFYASNYNGSYGLITKNGVQMDYKEGPILSSLGSFIANKGDVIYMKAYGNKSNTSNSSAMIIARFKAV